MAKFTDKCPDCGSYLNIGSGQRILSYPMNHEEGRLSIHLLCSEGCGYDCFDELVFMFRLDEQNPTPDKADYESLHQKITDKLNDKEGE